MAARKTTDTTETKKKTTRKEKKEEPTFKHAVQKHVVVSQEETAEQLRSRLQKDVDEYELYAEKAFDTEEMGKDYDEIKMRSTEYAESLKLVNYKVPEKISYDGKDCTRKEVGDKIVFFMTKESVHFNEIPTLKSIVEYWREPKDEIPFALYDKTVKTLNNMTYRGIPEWDGILMVSAFFSAMSEGYTKANIILSYWNAKASVLENRAKEIGK